MLSLFLRILRMSWESKKCRKYFDLSCRRWGKIKFRKNIVFFFNFQVVFKYRHNYENYPMRESPRITKIKLNSRVYLQGIRFRRICQTSSTGRVLTRLARTVYTWRLINDHPDMVNELGKGVTRLESSFSSSHATTAPPLSSPESLFSLC